MSIKKLIAQTLGLLALLSIAACEPKPTADGSGTGSSSANKLAADVDLGHGYVRRNGAIHFIGGGTTGTGADATRIDTPSHQVLKGFTDAQIGSFKTAEGLDVASFEALSEEYTRDKDRVYYKVISPGVFLVIRLEGADRASFEVLPSNVARDKNHVWYGDRILSGVDPATVELLRGDFAVFKDKDSVHYQYKQIPGADPASFKHIGSGYYADSNRVYWCADQIPDADPATFEVLGDSFVAKDKNSVYRSGELLPGYDVASLEFILHHPAGFQIFSDKNGIHVNKLTFPRSKPGKVEVIDNRTLKAGDLILLVEHSRNTPMTLFKENGKLMAESPAYEPMSRKAQGIITAEVTAGGLADIRINPLPGGSTAPSVPDWQMEVFKYVHPVERLIELGKRIQ
jgi:hypothetical protein